MATPYQNGSTTMTNVLEVTVTTRGHWFAQLFSVEGDTKLRHQLSAILPVSGIREATAMARDNNAQLVKISG